MKNVTVPVDVPADVLVALNESEQELKIHFQTGIAMMLFREGKLTLGKAIQLAGVSRFEFEKSLAKSKISVSDLSIEQVMADVEAMSTL